MRKGDVESEKGGHLQSPLEGTRTCSCSRFFFHFITFFNTFFLFLLLSSSVESPVVCSGVFFCFIFSFADISPELYLPIENKAETQVCGELLPHKNMNSFPSTVKSIPSSC